ncbi:unnamed protein product [Caenorhabditis bovis]|uniref:Conserved oligomeric Golgi complex subunit 2 n=1 Tax=Caenorhabditis bovis TaxID=2654633 RepID=A0A8S1F7G1_9PELO|nr:unnamed protein product [Caenorhabditis bovis]
MPSSQNGVLSPQHPFQSSSTFSIDESKLCFNKTHFNRPDFNVERFMNLARQKADLKTIQQDLRLYLRSVQNSMIELINDDYADFVHLSSNLVSLNDSLTKINNDIESIWEEFCESTRDSVGTAEKIENKCCELTANRERQSELRNRIAFLSAMEQLAAMLRAPPKKCSILWFDRVSSYLVEVKSIDHLHSDEEKHAYNVIMRKIESILCREGIQSVSGDCANLPLILSIAHLTNSSHALTGQIVSDVLYPKLVKSSINDQYLWLTDVYKNVNEMRNTWQQKLGNKYCGKVRKFLDETLLSFVLTFIDKCMGTVAVPSDTRLFHRCFMATQEFINNWPNAGRYRQELKSIRDKFNLVVYFKLETHKFVREIDNSILPDRFSLNERQTNEEFHCKVTKLIFDAIEHVWSDDVYIPSIVDKLWDFTLRLLLKHSSWCKALQKHFVEDKNEFEGIPTWKVLLYIRLDATELQAQVFDFALESIWTKLKDIEVDTTQFGHCLTKHGQFVDSVCTSLDNEAISLFASVLNMELALVTDVPKHYRWTKKAPPTTHSAYVENATKQVEEFRENLENLAHSNIEKMIEDVSKSAFSFFAAKAKEVQDSVEATGSSLSRFKRKNTMEGAVSDDDKIKIQIHHDASYLLEKSHELDITVDGLVECVDRFSDIISKINGTPEPDA